jgi:hypothetical protein
MSKPKGYAQESGGSLEFATDCGLDDHVYTEPGDNTDSTRWFLPAWMVDLFSALCAPAHCERKAELSGFVNRLICRALAPSFDELKAAWEAGGRDPMLKLAATILNGPEFVFVRALPEQVAEATSPTKPSADPDIQESYRLLVKSNLDALESSAEEVERASQQSEHRRYELARLASLHRRASVVYAVELAELGELGGDPKVLHEDRSNLEQFTWTVRQGLNAAGLTSEQLISELRFTPRSRKNVYLSSSWKNREQVREMAIWLREEGFEVYDFTDPECRKVPEIPPERYPDQFDPEKHVYADYICNPDWREAVTANRIALESCDAVILILPCGNDAHSDWALAVGLGRHSAVFGNPGAGERSPVHMWSNLITEDRAELLSWLKINSEES